VAHHQHSLYSRKRAHEGDLQQETHSPLPCKNRGSWWKSTRGGKVPLGGRGGNFLVGHKRMLLRGN
jgi:hypothetical protein